MILPEPVRILNPGVAADIDTSAVAEGEESVGFNVGSNDYSAAELVEFFCPKSSRKPSVVTVFKIAYCRDFPDGVIIRLGSKPGNG